MGGHLYLTCRDCSGAQVVMGTNLQGLLWSPGGGENQHVGIALGPRWWGGGKECGTGHLPPETGLGMSSPTQRPPTAPVRKNEGNHATGIFTVASVVATVCITHWSNGMLPQQPAPPHPMFLPQ